MKDRIVLLMIVVMCLAGIADAGLNILLCSRRHADSSHVGSETGSQHEDDTLVEWLESLGHTVDITYVSDGYGDPAEGPPTAGTALRDACEAADLIFFSRYTNSGDVDSDRVAWNSIETPLILNGNTAIIRGESSSTRWGWSTGGHNTSGSATTDWALTAGGTLAMFDWTGAVGNPKGVGCFSNAGEVASGGNIIATFNERPVWVEFPAGTDFDASNGTTNKYGVAGAERIYFGHWGYDSDDGPGDVRGKFTDYLTQEYKDTLADVIAVFDDPTFNPSPKADAGSDQSTHIGDVVQLAGTATDEGPEDGISEGSPGGIESFYWKQKGGPGTASFSATDVLDPTVTFDIKGTYEIMLQVTDGYNDANDIMVVRVKDHADEFIVGHWPLDGDALDATANGNDGTLMGTPGVDGGMPSYVAGAIGTGAIDVTDYLGLEAIDETDPNMPYIDLGAAEELNFGTTDFTVSAWIKSTQVKGAGEIGKGAIFANGADRTPGTRYCLILGEGANGQVDFVTDQNEGNVKRVLRTDGDNLLNDDNWHFVVGTRDGNVLSLYRDGVLDATSSVPAGYDLSEASQWNSYIGMISDAENGGLYKHYNGLVDDVRVYNYALPLDSDPAYESVLSLTAMGPIVASVDAGPDADFTWRPDWELALGGMITDNGSDDQKIVLWTTEPGGPGEATFISPSDPASMVMFPAGGTYVLKLTVFDEDVTVEDTVTITVIAPTCDDVVADGLLLATDLNGDCRVDLGDLAIMLANWAACNDPIDAACDWPFGGGGFGM